MQIQEHIHSASTGSQMSGDLSQSEFEGPNQFMEGRTLDGTSFSILCLYPVGSDDGAMPNKVLILFGTERITITQRIDKKYSIDGSEGKDCSTPEELFPTKISVALMFRSIFDEDTFDEHIPNKPCMG